jgi:hypothetical protein
VHVRFYAGLLTGKGCVKAVFENLTASPLVPPPIRSVIFSKGFDRPLTIDVTVGRVEPLPRNDSCPSWPVTVDYCGLPQQLQGRRTQQEVLGHGEPNITGSSMIG